MLQVNPYCCAIFTHCTCCKTGSEVVNQHRDLNPTPCNPLMLGALQQLCVSCFKSVFPVTMTAMCARRTPSYWKGPESALHVPGCSFVKVPDSHRSTEFLHYYITVINATFVISWNDLKFWNGPKGLSMWHRTLSSCSWGGVWAWNCKVVSNGWCLPLYSGMVASLLFWALNSFVE